MPKIISILACILCVCSLFVLTACQDKQEGTKETFVLPEADTSTVMDHPFEDRFSMLLDIRNACILSDETNYTITESPNGLTITGFAGAETQLLVPESIGGKPVIGIAATAFSGNTTICAVVLPNSIQSIELQSFKGCTSLGYLSTPAFADDGNCLGSLFGRADWAFNRTSVPLSLQYFSFTGETIPDNAFSNCIHLLDISLEKATSVGAFAFSNCSSLEEIQFSDSIKSIGERAFLNCIMLHDVFLPDSLTKAEIGLFEGCQSVRSLSVPFMGSDATINAEEDYLAFFFGASSPAFSNHVPASLESFILRDTDTLVPFAFLECTSLRTVVLPDSLTTISSRAFSGCCMLKGITIPENVTFIGKAAFYGCERLTQVTLSSKLTTIEFQAFQHCLSLKSITIPASVTEIPNSCFADCISLETVTMPNGIKIGQNAFHNTKYTAN